MKKLLLLLMMLLPTIGFSEVKSNNLTVNFGGYLAPLLAMGYYSSDDGGGIVGSDSGGGFNIELGFLKVFQSSIDAIDFRIRFDYNVYGYKPKNPRQIVLGSSTTYSIHRELKKGNLLMDVVGGNVGWSTHECVDVYKTEGVLVSVILPLGVQYVFDNGLTLGFRHRLDWDFQLVEKYYDEDADSVSIYSPMYNITLSIGYTFGM